MVEERRSPHSFTLEPFDPPGRSILEISFARLRQTIETKDITDEHLKRAALDALERAKARIERDSSWVMSELDRMRKALK